MILIIVTTVFDVVVNTHKAYYSQYITLNTVQ